MKYATYITTALMAAWSLPALSQVQTQATGRESFVGTWVLAAGISVPAEGQRTPVITEEILVLNADSTWKSAQRVNGVEDAGSGSARTYGTSQPSGRWYLSNDTIWFRNPAKLEPDVRHTYAAYRIARQGEQLTLGSFSQKCPPKFTRAPSAPPPVPTLPPATLKAADLVGTWIPVKPEWRTDGLSKDSLDLLLSHDTLMLRSDSTWRHRQGDSTVITGSWVLLAGNLLSRIISSSGINLLVVASRQEAQLVLEPMIPGDFCPEPYIYKRVSP